MSRLELGQRVLARMVPAMLAVALLVVWDDDRVPLMLGAWLGLLVLMLVVRARARLGLLLFLSLTLYGAAAYVTQVTVNAHFDPWPPLSLVTQVTARDLHELVVAYIVIELVIGTDVVDDSIRVAGARVREQLTDHRRNWLDSGLQLLLLGVGLFDAVRVALIGIAAVLRSERRAYADQLLLGNNHNVQVICMAATVLVVVRAYMIGRWRMAVISSAVCWLPFLLVGSRKEFMTVFVVLLIILLPVVKRSWAVAAGAGGVGAFVAPVLYTGDWVSPLHEFILPQYMQFTLALGLVPTDIGGTFLERAQFLLPSGLRLTPIQDFGHSFAELGVTGVGVGASPFAEADLNSFLGSSELSFVVLLLASVLLIIAAARRWPAFSLVSYALVLFYGRSDFWTLTFFAVYVAALISILGGFFRGARAPAGAVAAPARTASPGPARVAQPRAALEQE
jgi:hypothetical protein